MAAGRSGRTSCLLGANKPVFDDNDRFNDRLLLIEALKKGRRAGEEECEGRPRRLGLLSALTAAPSAGTKGPGGFGSLSSRRWPAVVPRRQTQLKVASPHPPSTFILFVVLFSPARSPGRAGPGRAGPVKAISPSPRSHARLTRSSFVCFPAIRPEFFRPDFKFLIQTEHFGRICGAVGLKLLFLLPFILLLLLILILLCLLIFLILILLLLLPPSSSSSSSFSSSSSSSSFSYSSSSSSSSSSSAMLLI